MKPYDEFYAELIELMTKHNLILTPSGDDVLQVWTASEKDYNYFELEDKTDK